MKSAPLFLVAAFAFASCGDGEDEGNDNTNPTTGTWSFVEGETFDNSCEVDYTDPNGDFEVTSTGDGTFTIDDGTYVFDCTVLGNSFNCPSRLTGTVWGVVSITISIAGTFSSATNASGYQKAELTCEGDHCVAGVPCSASQNFTASRAGP